jgi:uncharacterized protein (DUF4213/DUF364 family)
MYIHEKIYEKAKEKAKDFVITDVRIGLSYIAVEFNEEKLGLSYSFTKELPITNCNISDMAGSIIGKDAEYLLSKIYSYDLLESALGIAAANAILNINLPTEDMDILDTNRINVEDNVVMIGFFGPIISRLKNNVKKLTICEKDKKLNVLPDYAAYFELNSCDVAIISATTLVNKTIDGLMDRIKNAHTVVVLGATTTMDREIFRDTPITHLCGVCITDTEKVKQVTSQAGGTKALKPYTRKVCIKC